MDLKNCRIHFFWIIPAGYLLLKIQKSKVGNDFIWSGTMIIFTSCLSNAQIHTGKCESCCFPWKKSSISLLRCFIWTLQFLYMMDFKHTYWPFLKQISCISCWRLTWKFNNASVWDGGLVFYNFAYLIKHNHTFQLTPLYIRIQPNNGSRSNG